jgi:hypothetical protein
VTEPNGEYFSHGGMYDCDHVGLIPRSFLEQFNIPEAPGGRTYYCTAYADLFAYDRSNKSDRGIGFDFDNGTWSI